LDMLLVPNQSDDTIHSAMLAYAERRRALAILDLPAAVTTLAQAHGWLAVSQTVRRPNAAAFFPRVLFSDPANQGQVRSFANSGAVAGVIARSDEQWGVWHAPAGAEARIVGAIDVETALTDLENQSINELGLNAIRHMPVYGTIVWGSRTLAGADAAASDWKYVPVRRTALFIEKSLEQGLQWVVFEPNDEALWSQIRLNVGSFMQQLFRQQAFQGAAPREAYFVKCDSQTTSTADINSGVVNVVVGFAPLKPAEFVVFKLQLLAGQLG